MKAPKFEVYPTKAQHGHGGPARIEWRWRLRAANGRILCSGEAHTRRQDAVRAVDTICRVFVDGWPTVHVEGDPRRSKG